MARGKDDDDHLPQRFALNGLTPSQHRDGWRAAKVRHPCPIPGSSRGSTAVLEAASNPIGHRDPRRTGPERFPAGQRVTDVQGHDVLEATPNRHFRGKPIPGTMTPGMVADHTELKEVSRG